MARQHDRYSTALAGRLVAARRKAEGDESAADGPSSDEILCDILDLSAGGAKARPRDSIDDETVLALVLDKIGRFDVDVVWKRDGTLGLKFRDDPEKMAEVMLALALYR